MGFGLEKRRDIINKSVVPYTWFMFMRATSSAPQPRSIAFVLTTPLEKIQHASVYLVLGNAPLRIEQQRLLCTIDACLDMGVAKIVILSGPIHTDQNAASTI